IPRMAVVAPLRRPRAHLLPSQPLRPLRPQAEAMARARSSPAWQALADRHDPQALPAYVARYLEWLRVHNYAEPTVKNRELYLGFFVAWAAERGLTLAREITKPILERYQRSLYHHRKRNGEPLTFRGQH